MQLIRTLVLVLVGVLVACNPPPTEAQLDQTRGGRVDVYFNDPGTRAQNMWEPDAIDVLIGLIDQSSATLDVAAMGFNRMEVIEAVIRAYDRGVEVRFVGDAGHLYNDGYQMLDDRQIPMVTGNRPHIMHNKFFVIDGRFVFACTANITDTDLRHNSNNFILIDHPGVAADFTAEFEQMFSGKFGHTKEEIDNGRVYQVGDTEVEVWFSPNEDAMGRILENVDGAQESLRFTIFAFTKDQVGSAFIRKQEEWDALNDEDGIGDADFRDKRSIAGVVDRSQLHSNGQYHEAYRLLSAGIPMRLDADDNSLQPGDYQAGGGRLHSKTMIIDVYGDDPVVLSGSFNWSSSATVSNDEFLLVMRSPRIAQMYDDYFESLWANGREVGETFVGEDIDEGDVVLNEVMWFGLNDSDVDGVDEFIELRNTTGRALDLSMWQIANENDFVVGLPPGSVVPPNGYFLILDHTVEVYADGVPQNEVSAYCCGNLVTNAFNDNRQSRLYLKDGQMELRLQDPRASVVDRAGDGGPPFFGGPFAGKALSMERDQTPGDGTLSTSWHQCTAAQGGTYVNELYRDDIIATPKEPNSPAP